MDKDSEIIRQATWNDDNVPDWINNIDWDKYEQLAAIGYKPEQIAMYYAINKAEFMYFYMLFDSKLKYHYDRGKLLQQAKEGIGMMADAPFNSNTALRLDKTRRRIQFRTAIDDIIYGGF